MLLTTVYGIDIKETKLQGTVDSLTLSPLKQSQSGILSQDIQCSNGLELIFNSHNGSPTCVTPNTKIKLVERGWGIMSTLMFTNNISENNCGQFYTAPERQLTLIPVLLMDSNSTACTRLTFTIDHDYSNTSWPQIVNLLPLLTIGNYNYTSHGIIFSVSPGKDYTNSFQIIVKPQTIDLANFPIDSNFTVTYIIKPLSNATGFYDHSILRLACERYPLAVGYTPDHVNYSNFSYIDPASYPCGLGPYVLAGVEISGMGYKYVELPPTYPIQPND
jgi:hypothetical protein